MIGQEAKMYEDDGRKERRKKINSSADLKNQNECLIKMWLFRR